MFRPICHSAFFRFLISNLGVNTESRAEPFIWITGEDCSNSVNHVTRYKCSVRVSIPYRPIGIVVRVFVNGLGNGGSIPGRIIPMTQKWYLIPPCLTLSIIRYVSRVKWSNTRKGEAPQCSSNWKESPRVILNYGRRRDKYSLLFLPVGYYWTGNLQMI